MRIMELLIESYKLATELFSQSAPEHIVKTAVTNYKTLVDKNQVQGAERNIDYWRKQGWDKFNQFVQAKLSQPTKSALKKREVQGDSILLQETPEWLIVMPLSHTASCYYGKNTEWCTARPADPYFNNYFFDHDVNLIYCIKKSSGQKWAIASHKDVSETEMFDQADRSISESEFNQQTGLNATSIINLIPHDDPRISHVKTTRNQLKNKTTSLLNKWSKVGKPRNAEIEQILSELKNPEMSYKYVMGVGKTHGPQMFPEEVSKSAVSHRVFESKPALSALRYIANTNTSINRLSVKTMPISIKWIPQPDDTLKWLAIQADGYAIRFVPNPSPEMQMAVVKKSPYLIGLIKNPSQEVQMIAVADDPKLISQIKNPHADVIKLAQGTHP
jgi:hypothetical protein